MKKIFGVLVCSAVVASCTTMQKQQVYLADAAHLSAVKKQAGLNEKVTQQLAKLKNKAEGYLQMKPMSVMDKALTPTSGNKHDYMSQAPYFWYDSSKPNGLPYMRRDGVRNPEILKFTDRKNLDDLEKATTALSLAYHLLGEEQYATKTAQLIQNWFTNDATKMNPNLDFGQAVPGVNTGRGIGIIETIALTSIADNATLLKGSPSWSSADDKALKQWYADYLTWMLTSKNGVDELAEKNNHGTFYDMQVVHFALFTGNKKIAIDRLQASKIRMDEQIDAEGKMPLELERTTALGYTTYNLEAWFKLATLAEHLGVDLWHHKNKEGKGLQSALDYIIPYAIGEKPFPYQQINEYKPDVMYKLLLEASEKYKDPKYLQYATKLNFTPKDPVDAILLSKFK